jgi:hypothetical protein
MKKYLIHYYWYQVFMATAIILEMLQKKELRYPVSGKNSRLKRRSAGPMHLSAGLASMNYTLMETKSVKAFCRPAGLITGRLVFTIPTR